MPRAELGLEQRGDDLRAAEDPHLDMGRVEQREGSARAASAVGENAGALAVVAASVRSTQKRVEVCTCFVPATAVSVSRYQPSESASGAPGQLLLAGGPGAGEDRRHRLVERVGADIHPV